MKLLKFVIIGFSGLLIDFGITYLLKEKSKINKYYANAGGFVVAVVSNFFFNKYWTFNNNSDAVASQFLYFSIVSAIGLLINQFIIYLLNDKLKFNFYFAKLLAIGVVTIWNFSINYLFVF